MKEQLSEILKIQFHSDYSTISFNWQCNGRNDFIILLETGPGGKTGKTGLWKRKAADGMKILITGANGFLGQGIVKALLDTGNQVTAADFKDDRIDARAERYVCDLFAVENPYEYFREPDVLLHLAWKDGFVHYSDAHVLELPKHYAFIRHFAQSGVKRIAVMGSVHEVGFYEGSVKEGTPCNPVTPYGISKNALRALTEMVCRQNGVTYQWLRGYYITGGSVHGSSIFSKLVQASLEGKKEFPFTRGLNQFDFIDYDTFCAMTAAAVCQDEINGIINICSGRPEKLADRAEAFIKDHNYQIRLQYGTFPERPYDSKAVWGDDTKIRKILSIKSKTGGNCEAGFS